MKTELDDLTAQEQGLIETALIELESLISVRLKQDFWGDNQLKRWQQEKDAAKALREKLRDVYLVPVAREWSKKGVSV